MPGTPLADGELNGMGFESHDFEVLPGDVALSGGRVGMNWNTLGDIPQGPGVYLFTVSEGAQANVTYAGETEELWMVTKGRTVLGDARGGNRYGRPQHVDDTRQHVNALATDQIKMDRTVHHWLRSLANQPEGATHEARVALEAHLIANWDLRRVGWNR